MKKTAVKKTSSQKTASRGGRSRPTPNVPEVSPLGERLQKVLAQAGFGSRRDCEELILAGRVTVDDKTVTELGTRVLPEQEIRLDGEAVRKPKKKVYFVLNKPDNVICSNDDPSGRMRAIDLIRENAPGLFPVGRLDLHSEGLLLVTNDGELANRLTHPSYEVPKVYRVRVSGAPTRDEIAQLCRGVYLAEGKARADEVRIHHQYRDGTAVLEVTLREGRNREIRRILAKIGHNVLDLVRISVGPVKLGRLPVGMYRPLSTMELRDLKKLVGLR
ncbi:MAG: pseudouridine synthase [Planctomycetia bacterium]|nr:pseudouridine synthase [Planctomycetia bacterium]